jgi:hypothetical protein
MQIAASASTSRPSRGRSAHAWSSPHFLCPHLHILRLLMGAQALGATSPRSTPGACGKRAWAAHATGRVAILCASSGGGWKPTPVSHPIRCGSASPGCVSTSEPCVSPSRSRADGQGRTATALSVAPCRHRRSRQTRRAAVWGRDRTPYGGWRACTRGDAPTLLARRQSDQHRGHRTAERDVPGTPRAAGAPLPGAGTLHLDAARWAVPGGYRL